MSVAVDQAERGYNVALQVGENAVWASNPAVQIATNAIIIIAAMLSSAVGFAPGIVIAMFAFIGLGVGTVRLLYGVVGGNGFSLPTGTLTAPFVVLGVVLVGYALTGSITLALGGAFLTGVVYWTVLR